MSQITRVSDGNIEARLNDDGTITVYDVNVADTFGEFEEIITVNKPHLAGQLFRRPNHRAGVTSAGHFAKLYESLMHEPEMQDYL